MAADTLTPMGGPVLNYLPCKSLAADLIRLQVKYFRAKDETKQREAREFFASPDLDYWAEIAGVDPDAVRSRLHIPAATHSASFP